MRRHLNETLPSLAILCAILAAAAATGCTSTTRKPYDQAYLLQRREEAAKSEKSDARGRFLKFIEMLKTENDDYGAGRRTDPPIIDILIISGGGDWGAFGAGFLKGWATIPGANPMAKPKFDVVTGVSTGALIAPFAFIGDAESIDQVVQLYRNPQKDWVKKRWPLYFLPGHLSFATVPGLERELRNYVTREMVARIALGGKDGRMLAVNTTCLDEASSRVFYLNSEAERATETGDLSRIHNIMLASAGIPGAFPYREIDGLMYVDGGVTSNILYGGRVSEEESVPALWQRLYPNIPIPKIRYWVIFNNRLHAPPEVVKARWIEIITRSIELSTRAATLTAIRHLYARAEISRLTRHADVEIRTVAVPDDWVPPVEGAFVKETMNNLADLGEKMGADPASWSTQAPQ